MVHEREPSRSRSESHHSTTVSLYSGQPAVHVKRCVELNAAMTAVIDSYSLNVMQGPGHAGEWWLEWSGAVQDR